MKNRIITILMIFLVCFSTFQLINNLEKCEASILPKFYVDDDYNSETSGWQIDHFDTIQDAIDSPNCTNGDRIIVYQGTYNENIIINKSIDLFGEDRSNTIIDGGNGPDVLITAANVDISSFTITDSSAAATDAACVQVNADNCKIVDNIIKDCAIGVFVNDSNFVTIAYNSITDNGEGIFFSSSSRCINNTLEHNNIYKNQQNGIYMNDTCNYNTISNNNIYSNGYNGIFLQNHCNHNTISENSVYSNTFTGIRIDNCSSNTIYRNSRISNNDLYGVMISGSNNTVEDNIIADNNFHGIFLIADDDSTISENTISENTYEGIRIHNSSSAIIKENYIKSNSRYGIHINYYAVNNLIYNNFFSGNDCNARDISQNTNLWNQPKTTGSNILKGPYIGGNYWEDYSGNDSDGDALGDENYIINGNSSIDQFPLMYQLPSADTSGPYSASTGEKISFDASDSISPDGNITSYNWDFGDESTGSGKKTSHTYTEAGTYTVTLTIYNNLGGSDSETTTATITDDTIAPTITINQKGEKGGLSNLFTFSAYVTDNVEVDNVWIEYWYSESNGKMTANMENTASTLYKKVITTQKSTDEIYCVIYANDTSGNTANTKSPYADIGDPYSGCQVLEEITFDASGSFDLDGNISSYEWDFGDGKKGSGEKNKHIYYANDLYTVTLTITDDDGNTDSDSTSLIISSLSSINASIKTVNNLANWSNTDLNESIYAYDTDGDDVMDAFSDENDIFSNVKTSSFKADNKNSFLISANEDLNKLYIWNVEDDKIINVTYQKGAITEDKLDKFDKQRTVKIQVNKAEWIYIEVSDKYPEEKMINILRSDNSQISDDMISRKNNKIYILDDPSTVYKINYEYTPPPIGDGEFLPLPGSTIGKQNNTISIYYNVPVEIIYGDFYNLITGTHINIKDKIKTVDDNKTFVYTPAYNLEEGEYQLQLEVRSIESRQTSEDAKVYKFEPYTPESQKLPIMLILLLTGIIGGIIIGTYILSKKLDINLESFIYFKNKKIIPFFKPFVFGPLRINVKEDNIKKAEFYVNGKLHETITEPPYNWDYDKTGIMRPKIEAKVYDNTGNESSTGEMTFYVFNNRLFR